VGLNGAEVSGTVLNGDNQPLADVAVVLLPDSRAGSLYREARAEQDGTFHFRGLPPGDYHVLAVEDLEAAPYREAEYLKTTGAKAEAVSLKAGDNKAVQLKVGR